MESLEFPPPDPDALDHSRRLTARICQEIDAAGGALPFDRFMDLALYAPGLGYYVAGSRKLGPGGDFVTAPEISPLFARCLARQCAEVLGRLGGGDILEFGAGSGALALELVRELERLGTRPGRYLILEPSPELRERQREALAALPVAVHWLERPPPEGFRGVVLANEVLDAMPVHRFAIRDGRVRESFVTREGDGFREQEGDPATPGLAAAVRRTLGDLSAFPDGYGSEINLRLAPWIESLGEALEAGLALLIDYGYPRREYYLPERGMGTLMCHYRHRAHSDPYRLVGLQDITAHVDFTAVAEAGQGAGLTLGGYTSQANFLLGCGLDDLLTQVDSADTGAYLDLVQGAKQLILPTGMGERFQVLGLSRGLDGPLRGFGLRDLSHRL